MAPSSQELAIAQAALSASLFRADPTSLSRSQVEAFFPLLQAAVTQCSRSNVQKCKYWIVDNVAHSRARTAALGKYALALSRSWDEDADHGNGKGQGQGNGNGNGHGNGKGNGNGATQGQAPQRPSVKRKKLHLLYVVSDALNHVVVRQGKSEFAGFWDGHLLGLVAAAAAFGRAPKHRKKLDDLLKLWDEQGYFSPEQHTKLRDALASGSVNTTSTSTSAAGAPAAPGQDPSSAAAVVKLAKDTPFHIPSHHGDPSAPWFDLPTATWLPQLTPNSSRPMNPDLVAPLQLAAGPANKAVADAVRSLLSDADKLFSKSAMWEGGDADSDKQQQQKKKKKQQTRCVNELGEMVVLDEITGDVVGGETYYGWSRPFCEKMRLRRKNKPQVGAAAAGERGRSRSRSLSHSSRSSRSRSRSSSPRAFKRRRLSPSSGRSLSRSQGGRGRDFSQSSPSRSRSRSRPRRRESPPPPPLARNNNYQYPHPHGHAQPPPPPLPPPPHAQQGHHFPPNFPGIPPPPPIPPTGYNGPWPPPLPPPPPHPGQHQQHQQHQQHPPNWTPDPALMQHIVGGWGGNVPPPPPPPFPPHQQGGRGSDGNGYGNSGGRGRGGGYGWRG